MVNIEGQIEIDLTPQTTGLHKVLITSSRPVQAIRVMIGKSPEAALSSIPLLFNICGIAQARTAVQAISQNLNIQIPPDVEIARDMLVLVENAREHLTRLFIDWPRLFDMEINNSQLSILSQLLNDFKQSLFEQGNAFSLDSKLQLDTDSLRQQIDKLQQSLEQQVFKTNLEQWLSIDKLEELKKWSRDCDTQSASSINSIFEQGWESQGFSEIRPMPELELETLEQRFDAEDANQFIAQPDWQGNFYETTTLSRQWHQPLIIELNHHLKNGLITRWVSRLVELAQIPQQLNQLLNQLENNSPTEFKHKPGIALTEAARGRLIHRVKIDKGAISNYQILAPTEWNFHPQGLITKSLENLSVDDPAQLEKMARLLINAIDPCVGYELRIH